ncbi:hypothetical protein EST38_g9719 [Candolleomyces aberdarensis]|uniref:Uncharacterized protein n=1 Tax=Candolleomyces aberdarensis TaxID=2316362 RepID=A0A4Q2DCH8_9AGAR|nr:hypothetical protein EST38_g9719 [Candolleomyces aberdarensis]
MSDNSIPSGVHVAYIEEVERARQVRSSVLVSADAVIIPTLIIYQVELEHGIFQVDSPAWSLLKLSPTPRLLDEASEMVFDRTMETFTWRRGSESLTCRTSDGAHNCAALSVLKIAYAHTVGILFNLEAGMVVPIEAFRSHVKNSPTAKAMAKKLKARQQDLVEWIAVHVEKAFKSPEELNMGVKEAGWNERMAKKLGSILDGNPVPLCNTKFASYSRCSGCHSVMPPRSYKISNHMICQGAVEPVTVQVISVSNEGKRNQLVIPFSPHRLDELNLSQAPIKVFTELPKKPTSQHSIPQSLATRWKNLKEKPLSKREDTWHSLISPKLPYVENPIARRVFSHLPFVYKAYGTISGQAEAYASRLHSSVLQSYKRNFKIQFKPLTETTTKSYSKLVERILRFIVIATLLEVISMEPVLNATDRQRVLFKTLVSQLEMESPDMASLEELVYRIGLSLLETPLSEMNEISNVIEQCLAVKYITSSPQSRRISNITSEISKARRFLGVIFFYRCSLASQDVACGNADSGGGKAESDGDSEDGDEDDDDDDEIEDDSNDDSDDEVYQNSEGWDSRAGDEKSGVRDGFARSRHQTLSQATSFEDYDGVAEKTASENTAASADHPIVQLQMKLDREYFDPEANPNSCLAQLFNLWGAIKHDAKLEPKAVKVSWAAGMSSFIITKTHGYKAEQSPQITFVERLKYRRKDNEAPNVILRAVGGSPHQVFITCPDKKRNRDSAHDVAWLLPPELGMALVLYLGIIRPIEVEFLRVLHCPLEELVRMSYQVFVCPAPAPVTSSHKLDGAKAIQVESTLPKLGLGFNCQVLRQLMLTILRTENPSLLEGLEEEWESTLNHASQHSTSVGHNNYAVDAIKHATGLTELAISKVVEVSTCLQRVLGVIPSEKHYLKNVSYALNIARLETLRVYGEFEVWGVFDSQPFIQLPQCPVSDASPTPMHDQLLTCGHWTGRKAWR